MLERRHAFSIALFLAAASGVGLLWRGATLGQSLAFVESSSAEISSMTLGRLDRVLVGPGDEVKAGEPLVLLDARAIQAELRVLRAEREQLSAQLEAARFRSQLSEDTLRGGLSENLDSLQVSLAEARSRRNAKRLEKEALDGRILESQALLEKQLVDRRVVDDLSLRRTVVAAELTSMEELIAQLSSSRSSAEKRRDVLPIGAAERESAPIEAALKVLGEREKKLELAEQELTITAPSDGRVLEVLVRPSTVVSPGLPILRLLPKSGASPKVRFCLSSTQARHLGPGTRFELSPEDGGEALTGAIVGVSEQIGPLPPRCFKSPAIVEYGREAFGSLDPGQSPIPGSRFRATFGGSGEPPITKRESNPPGAPLAQNGASPTEPRSAPLASDRGLPLPISVPNKLLEQTRFEASAIVWEPALGSFVVASDDTGHKSRGNDGVPWAFRLGPGGDLSPEPLLIMGIEELNDVEGLARCSTGTVYALSSQSLSRSGKRSAARQLFAELALSGDHYEVRHKTSLFSDLAQLKAQELESLGLAGERGLSQLDVEGLTCTRDGGLLLALKAPLSTDGKAMVWKVERPATLLRGEGVRAAGLSLVLQTSQKVNTKNGEVLAGLSDLLSLESGEYLASATASQGDPESQDGIVFRLLPDGSSELLWTFPGEKPEGLALTENGNEVLVVFDRGASGSAYAKLPLPRHLAQKK